ncbi:MAG: FAD:protein FMN transferase [Pseudomonadales bacterium]|nr:FAD:protein FMN transferase [Pseudomonadales bacterium]
MLVHKHLMHSMMKFSRAPFYGLAIISGLLISACQPTETISVVSGKTMGTTYQVSIVHAPSETLESIHLKIDKELININNLMSTYDNESEISRFNRAEINRGFALSPETFQVVQFSLLVARLTNGAFDPTVGPLVDLWGFGPPGGRQIIPDEAAIKSAKSKVGFQSLILTSEPATLTARQPRHLDLSAVAKGFAVDQIGALLQDAGYQSFLVEIGGELLAKGSKPGGLPWRVAVELPESRLRSILRTLPLIDQAIATSGDYRNYFEYEARRFSHTLDPRTGNPVTHKLTSVTVLADTAMKADGWATGLAVLGPVDGLELADQLGIAALMLVRGKDNLTLVESRAFKDYLNRVNSEPGAP